ncbi:MAG: hypothetical protein ABH881_01285 [bacterium]
MFRYIKNIFFIGFVVILFNLFSPLSVNAELLRPMVVEINQEKNSAQPIFSGITEAGTDIVVYIDDQEAGNATINDEGTGTDNFYYQPQTNISTGTHDVYVVAKDKYRIEDPMYSNKRMFYVESVSPYVEPTNSVPMPTIISPSLEQKIIGEFKPLITGLTMSGTNVAIYIDGKLQTTTKVLEDESGTANFSFQPQEALPIGKHLIAVATEYNGRTSAMAEREIQIAYPTPAPIILTPLFVNDGEYQQPVFRGLAKNNLIVKIFIDGKLDGSFSVKNDISGTANFSYVSSKAISAGVHTMNATTVDNTGKESKNSNSLNFTVKKIVVSAVTEEVEPEEDVAVKSSEYEEDDDTEEEEPEVVIENEPNVVIETEKASTSDEIRKLFEDSQTKKENETTVSGQVDENNEQQNKLKLNILIFSLFLLAIIGWIFWVNRELIREKKESEKADETSSEDEQNNT